MPDAVAMSEADRAALARFVDPRCVRLVPNGVSCRDFPLREAAPEPARPVPLASMRRTMSSSTWMFQAKSYSPVCSTARAAEAASPPPFISKVSKNGRLGMW